MSQRSDSKANAERIRTALCQLWTSEGAPSLERVADTAGVGIATLYRHYPSRAALEQAAFAHIFTEEVEPVIARAARTAELDLITVTDEFVAVVGRYAPVFRAIELSEVTDEALDSMSEPFIGLLRSGQEAGVLREDLEPLDLFWVLRMLMLGLTSAKSSPSIRRRYLALIIPSITPDGPAIPGLATNDYERFGVAPEHRGPLITD